MLQPVVVPLAVPVAGGDVQDMVESLAFAKFMLALTILRGRCVLHFVPLASEGMVGLVI